MFNWFKGNKKYLVMLYTAKNSSNGGLGDRIVGLVSAILLAKKTKRELRISWLFPDIEGIIHIPKQYAASEDINSLIERKRRKNRVRDLEMIDKQTKYKDVFCMKDLETEWPEDIWICRSNQNFIQYLYTNPHYVDVCQNYKEDLINTYKSIFEEYLVPTDSQIGRVDGLRNSNRKLVGIQIRMGDHYMGVGKHQPVSNLEQVKKYLSQIKKVLMDTKLDAMAVDIFITSDHAEVHDVARGIFNEFNVLGDSNGVTHIDRKPETEKLASLFRDFLMLCRSDYLFFSMWSNFGRVSALMNGNEVYALSLEGGVSPVDWRSLSSKHDILQGI